MTEMGWSSSAGVEESSVSGMQFVQQRDSRVGRFTWSDTFISVRLGLITAMNSWMCGKLKPAHTSDWFSDELVHFVLQRMSRLRRFIYSGPI